MKNKIILFSKKILKALKVFISRVLADGGIIEAKNYVNSVLKTVTDASLVLIPSAYKTGVLYSILPEDGTGDFTFSRPSGATRVNSQGLIEEVSLLGDELIVNGGFDTDTDWVKDAGWTISGGALNRGVTGLFDRVYQVGVIEADKTYKLSFDVIIVTGSIPPNTQLGGTVIDTTITESGSYDFILTTANALSLSIYGSTDFEGSIDNVSVKEVFEEGIPRIDYTDGTPVLLTEPQSTNLYLNSDILVTQNITTLASTYTVSFYGLGTINFTGTYTGSLIGTGEKEKVSITFVANAGTLISTVVGVVSFAQLEALPYPTSYIPTAGATATRLGEVVTVDLSSFVPTITEIIETIDGTDQTPITVIPATYTIPFGNINKIIMNS